MSVRGTSVAVEDIPSLQQALEEFYSPHTDNQRKSAIEASLETLKTREDSLSLARLVLTTPSCSPVTQFFAASILETVVRSKWSSLDVNIRCQVRCFLDEYLVASYKTLPPFVWNKLAYDLVAIAKRDWPSDYPSFIDDTVARTTSPATTLLGITLVKVTAEEFVSTRADITFERKEALKGFYSQKLQHLLSLLKEVLNSRLQTAAADETDEVASSALATVEILVSWMPLDKYMTPDLLESVFAYIRLNNDLSIRAFECVNEILSRNYVPTDFSQFLMQIFGQVFGLLRALTEADLGDIDERFVDKFTRFTSLFVSNHIKRVESNPNFPFVEFLELFFKYTCKQTTLEGYTSCLETWCTFIEYMYLQHLAFKTGQDATAEQALNARYEGGLMTLARELLVRLHVHEGVGNNFMESCISDAEERDEFVARTLTVIARVADIYPDKVLELTFPLLSSRLDEIETSLNRCFANRGTGTGVAVSADVSMLCETGLNMLQCLARLVEHFDGVQRFQSSYQGAVTVLHRLLRFGNVLNSLQVSTDSPESKETFDSRFSPLDLGVGVNRQNSLVPPTSPAHVRLHAQVFCSLRAFVHWFSDYSSTIAKSPVTDGSNGARPGTPSASEFAHLVGQVVDVCVATVSCSPPPPNAKEALTAVPHSCVRYYVTSSAISLLESITSTVRPPGLAGHPSFSSLVSTLNTAAAYMPLRLQARVYTTVANALLLPQREVAHAAQKWEERGAHFMEFFRPLSSSFVTMLQSPSFVDGAVYQQPGAIAEVRRMLVVVSALAESVCNKTKNARVIVYEGAVKSILPVTLGLFQLYFSHPRVLGDLVQLYMSLFDSLKDLIGLEYIQSVISNFLEVLSKDQLAQIVRRGIQDEIAVVVRFLDLLNALVQFPRKGSSKAFLPDVISVCTETLYPLVSGDGVASDVKRALFSTLHHCVLHNWRFFSGSVGAGVGKHEAALNSIFAAYLESFQQNDINAFRQNVGSLTTLDEKIQLFSRPIFRSNYFVPVLESLMRALIARTHDVFKDESIALVFLVASSNFDAFYNQAFPAFISRTGLLPQVQHSLIASFGLERDSPTFTKRMEQFINDINMAGQTL